ncbi:MAG: transglycosylase domain-containing protein [Anaerolineae bacterium]|nr:transglycosylase domain-containing protein [Anaerolineae bacterium]
MRATRIMRNRQQRESRKRSLPLLFLWLVLAVLLAFFIFTGAVVTAGVGGTIATLSFLTSDLPDLYGLEKLGQDVNTTFETTKIYAWGADEDGDGNRDPVLIYEIIDPFGGDRQWIPLDEIPQSVIDATIAIEDKTFWENPGFDAEGIGRAFYEYIVLGGAIQGGSSITQQLVKNTLIEPERRVVGIEVGADDYRRKFEELVVAAQATQTYSKEQILEWYLNTNFYGNLAYGIEAAARVYFDKPATELTLAEATLLAAIPQSPALNPIDNPEQARQRQGLVLDAMLEAGFIDRAGVVEAVTEPVTVKSGVEERFDIIAPHFAQMVRDELERQLGAEQVVRGGLTVYTTLDLTMQAQAECVAAYQVQRLSGEVGPVSAESDPACAALQFLRPLPSADVGVDHNVNNAAVVMLDPRTGEIKALVGSVDYWDEAIDGSFNVAADGLRQPGSSFKPFTYVTALSEGYTAASLLLDVETDFGTPFNGQVYVPQNYDRQFHGPMRMRTALANSYNVPAVEAMSWVGVDKVLRMAHRMGITSLEDNTVGLQLTLGGGEVKLIDMVYAFSVFANMGMQIGQPVDAAEQRLGYRELDPVSILRVEDRNGQVIYEYNRPNQRQILTPQLAFLMNDILSDTTARCPAFGCPNALELPDRPVAAKTGTTNNYRDAWTVGYTPQLVTGVWIGNTDNSEMEDVPGSKGAAPVWQALMTWAHQGESVLDWPVPSGLVQQRVCALNGQLPSPHCPTTVEYFSEGTQPTIIDSMYQTFRINRETGTLATAATPPELVEEKVFIVYPERAADWARENEIELPPVQFDDPGNLAERAGDVVIIAPEPFGFISDLVAISGNARGDNFAWYSLAAFPSDRPDAVQSITPNDGTAQTNGPLGVWDTTGLEDGSYTLVLTVQRHDGVAQEYRSEITVDNTPPSAEILFPLSEQQIFTDDDWVVVQAQVLDEWGIERVEFFVDSAEVPFAINTVPPFTEKWTIPGPGCHSFRVVAWDAAGNDTTSEAVPVCIVERQ